MRHRTVISSSASIGSHGREEGDVLELMTRAPAAAVAAAPLPHVHRRRRGQGVRAIDAIDLSDLVPPRSARRMSRSSQWAVATARQALTRAGIEAGPGPDLGTYMATAFGPSGFTSGLLTQIFGAGPQTASPFLFTDCVANAPAGQIAIACQARGPNLTVCQRESGPLQALVQASLDIRWGRTSRALVGAVDEIDPWQLEILDRMRAMTADPRGPRPFDRRRDGFMVAEGASCLLLESEQLAISRDQLPLCAVAATGRAFDPSAPAEGFGTGAPAFAAEIRASLQAAEIGPGEIEAVLCSASGSRAGDRFEAAVLHELFPTRMPLLLTPKAWLGEYGGGCLEVAALAASGGLIPAHPGDFEADPALGISLREQVLPAGPHRILVLGLGSGGAGAWVVLEGI